MEKQSPIFEQTYRDYLRQLSHLNLGLLAREIGTEIDEGTIIIPLFGQPHRISPSEIINASGREPIHSVKVVLCQYLLHFPAGECTHRDWVSYRDFKGATPFVSGFQNNTERALAKSFSGRITELRKACLLLGGHELQAGWGYQLSMTFDALPHVPILLLFNDADEEFAAQCLLLFERRASGYLDMECLAILAWLLTDHLHRSGGASGSAVM